MVEDQVLLYSYYCESCEEEFESLTNLFVERCPECNQYSLILQIQGNNDY